MSEYKDYGFYNTEESHIMAYLLDPLLGMLDPNKNKLILDVGCGNGWLANILLKKGYNVYGTDASENGIKLANGVNKGRFFVQDLSKDGLPEELERMNFDTIISTEVIEHLYDPRKYVQFCKRVLSKGGKPGEIIISTPYHGYLKNLVLAVTGKMDSHFSPLWDGGHIKFWSKNTLSSVLEEAGFKVTDFKGCGRMPFLWKSMLIKAKLN